MKNKELYSVREIDIFMQDIKETLERIEMQTTRTNGRVSSLENWKSFITGGLAILSALMLPVIFMVVSNYLK